MAAALSMAVRSPASQDTCGDGIGDRTDDLRCWWGSGATAAGGPCHGGPGEDPTPPPPRSPHRSSPRFPHPSLGEVPDSVRGGGGKAGSTGSPG